MSTIADLELMGYTVGIAHGSVAVEEDALDAARADASLDAITAAAGRLTTATLDDLANAGKLPVTTGQRQQLAEQIATTALDMVTAHANDKVEFHERALEIAKTMPNVWYVDQTVDVGDGTQQVVSIYVACKEDGTGWNDDAQALLDALAHPPSYAERVFQVQNQDAIQAAQQLAGGGSTVDRDAAVDTFTVDGKTLDAAAVIALADEGQA